MPTPANRSKIRLVRGNYSNIVASISDLVDGELCYAKDQNKLYMVEGTALTALDYADSSSLNELIQDTVSTTLVEGENISLTYDDTAGTITIASTGGSGGSSTIDGLSDVNIYGLADNQILRYDSSTSKWVNEAAGYLDSSSTLGDLQNVADAVDSPNSGDSLVWSGTEWTSARVDLSDLGDVSVSSPSGNQLLRYSTITQKWTNFTPSYLTAESDTLDTVTDRGSTTQNDISVGKIYFKNIFDQISDLPSAVNNHGMFAHVHATGKAYYAHNGEWVELHSGDRGLDSLTDVTISSTPSNNSLLVYNSSSGEWEPGFQSIDLLTDVDTSTTAPVSNNLLKWSGSSWVPGDISINNLSDVDTATTPPADGEILSWDGTTSKWKPVSGASGGLAVTSVSATSPLSSSGGYTPTISIQDASTTQKGAVQLEDSTSSTSTTKAATPSSVKTSYDLAAAALPKSGGTLTGSVSFAAGQTFPGVVTSVSGSSPVVVTGTTSPTISVNNASTSSAGIVQLSSSVSSTSNSTAATSGSVKTAYDLANNALPSSGGNLSGNLVLENQSDVVFREASSNGTNYVALQAPSALSSNTTYTLPSADGTSGAVLQTNGSGVLSWSSASGGGIADAPADGKYYIRYNNTWVDLATALSALGIDAGQAT